MNDFNLKIPMYGEARTRVTGDNTALKFGSGKVDVFGTPAMIALMEESSINTYNRKWRLDLINPCYYLPVRQVIVNL